MYFFDLDYGKKNFFRPALIPLVFGFIPVVDNSSCKTDE